MQRAWSYSCCVRGSDTINRACKERGHTVVVSEGQTPSTEHAKSVVIQLLCQRVRHHQQSKQRAWSYSCCVRGSDTINRACKERGHTVVVSEGQTPLTEHAKSVVIQLLCQRVRHHQQSMQRAWSYSCCVRGSDTINRACKERGHTVVVSEGQTPLTEHAKSVVIQLLCQRVRHHQQSMQRAWSYSCCVRGSDTINRASKERGHTVVVSEGQTPSTEHAKSVVIQLCQRVRHHQQSKQRAWSYSCCVRGSDTINRASKERGHTVVVSEGQTAVCQRVRRHTKNAVALSQINTASKVT